MAYKEILDKNTQIRIEAILGNSEEIVKAYKDGGDYVVVTNSRLVTVESSKSICSYPLKNITSWQFNCDKKLMPTGKFCFTISGNSIPIKIDLGSPEFSADVQTVFSSFITLMQIKQPNSEI